MLTIRESMFLHELARAPITDDIIVIQIHNDNEVVWRVIGDRDLYYYVGILQGTIYDMIGGDNSDE